MDTYDVIIVGAGPAGLMAAREFTKSNLKYLIVDSKNRIGYPLRCGEVTREETFLELFEHTDYPFITNKISRFSFHVNNVQRSIKQNFLMLDKPQFLEWLSDPVKDHINLDTRFETLIRKDGVLEIITNKGSLQTKLAVIASGTHYKLQKELGLITKDVELVPCIGGLFRNRTLDSDTARFYYDEENSVALWVFPKGSDIINAGAGVMLKSSRTDMHNLKDVFKQLMKKFKIPFEGEPSFGGSYVTSGPIEKTYCDHILFCGDSAGHVFAGVGEGIYFSLKAGQIAGKTAIEAVKRNNYSSEFLQRYERNWKESFGRQMDAGLIFATGLFFLMRLRLTRTALRLVNPKEIQDLWLKGEVSLRLKLLSLFLKSLGCSTKR
ncbi:MAG: NAD(P)/FAD-dependent oxidoreductase [Deltaproteobacteria bacterium]|nr:NAD(P)/FAD-dependent oxidoreductase [Deltaproteobacteria bacterium]